MDLFFDEFIGDIVISKTDRAINSRHEVLLNLIKKLIEAVQFELPNKHELFKKCLELNPTGFKRLYNCYEVGRQWLIKIFYQEILQLEPINTTGRRAKEVIISKIVTLKKAEKEQKQTERLKETHQ